MNKQARIPPQATDVEESVLGAIMTDGEAADMAFMSLKPDDFYKPANKHIFETLLDLYERSSPHDMLTLETKLKDGQLLDQVGGVGYLADLTRSVSGSANVEYHCQIIREKAIRRNLITECSNVISMAYDTSTDTGEVVDNAQQKMFDVLRDDKGTMKSIREIMLEVSKKVDHIQEAGQPLGLRTGLDFDKTLCGFQNSKFYIIGARPSMGKTALVMTIIRRLARDNHNSGVLSLETSHESIGVRLIVQSSNLESDRILSGRMNDMELRRFAKAMSELSEHGIIVDDEPAITVQKLRAKCRLMVKKGVKIIFVDFLQLMHADGRTKHEEIGSITKGLKQISKELDIPIVALSQLSRKVEDRTNKRPQMADLRESGSIEEDADCIMFLYRPEYYGVTTTEDGRSTDSLCEVIIAKNKDGKTGFHNQKFIKEYMRFENMEHIRDEQDAPALDSYYEPKPQAPVPHQFGDESPF